MIKVFNCKRPSPNFYSLPTTFGYSNHILTKYRNPAPTIGRKIQDTLNYGHGMLYNIRDQTRYGKVYQRNYNFSKRSIKVKDFVPGPNVYYPEKALNIVKPKGTQISMKSRTNIKNTLIGNPAPNMYTLTSSIKIQHENRMPIISKPLVITTQWQAPAPNIYHLPTTNKYKYPNAMEVKMKHKINYTNNNKCTPAPNLYNTNNKFKTQPRGKSFGQNTNFNKIVYLTADDLKQ
ncbi:outer dense fiber protein 3-like protein 2 isoform X2 [Daktulosphaira vitifoliae]|uniref:outer dense fiber protein 3-like protein 2 isoform X2 n=1 Tax=Daktulosphaira vitifoliae TaxID=58002 RepID=UPI0021AA9FFC|nr:outer dense fiber protein 3-like protein 2 isoform X2 [Daktulosphaira vitifoliae]